MGVGLFIVSGIYFFSNILSILSQCTAHQQIELDCKMTPNGYRCYKSFWTSSIKHCFIVVIFRLYAPNEKILKVALFMILMVLLFDLSVFFFLVIDFKFKVYQIFCLYFVLLIIIIFLSIFYLIIDMGITLYYLNWF